MIENKRTTCIIEYMHKTLQQEGSLSVVFAGYEADQLQDWVDVKVRNSSQPIESLFAMLQELLASNGFEVLADAYSDEYAGLYYRKLERKGNMMENNQRESVHFQAGGQSKTNYAIENNFSYHAPTAGQKIVYEQMRGAFKAMAYLIDANVPDSREKSLAMTKLEEASMWANAGVARNADKNGD